MTKKYELSPVDGRKSFYGKCYVLKDDLGNEVLYSYNTKIMTKYADGNMVRHYAKWTSTTGRHIKAFCGLNKADFIDLEVVLDD